MRERNYSEEWYTPEPELLDIQLDEDCIEIAIEHSDELMANASAWFSVYYEGRNLARRPPYDEETCRLKGLKLVPYSTPGDRQPAIVVIGTYDVDIPHSDPDRRGLGEMMRVTRYDHEPLFLHIETYGGNFDHFAFLLEQSESVRVLELSPEFSTHVAELMKDYYDLFCSP
jgi:hypothetical protein